LGPSERLGLEFAEKRTAKVKSMNGIGDSHSAPQIIILDRCPAFSRGISTILDDIGLPTTLRINTIVGFIQKFEVLTTADDRLVICGPHLDDRSVFGFFRWLRDSKPSSRSGVKSMLISAQTADRNFYLDVAANHVQACVPYDLPCEQIAQAIQDVLSGRTLFSSQELEQAFRPIPITSAERQVLRLMAEGKTDREIAQMLWLSYRTVRNHAHRILTKLNVNDRNAAIARAYRRGILEERPL
jgi:DNA-binding NarL/FixJ family response regulator